MELNKKDIAVRHTIQAIRMFFHKEDPVSTLVIACAANHILNTLVSKQNLPIIIGYRGGLVKLFAKKEDLNKIDEKRNEAYNFFKHAEKDYDKTINFNPDLVWYFILENIIYITQLDIEYSKEMAYFVFWLRYSKRNLFVKNKHFDDFIKNFSITPDDFFDLYDELINKQFSKDILQNFKKWIF